MQPTKKEYPTDRVLSYKELLTSLFNERREQIIEEIAMLHDALQRKAIEPTLMVKTGQGLKSITEICIDRAARLFEFRENLKAVEMLLAEVSKGGDFSLIHYMRDEIVLAEMEIAGYKNPVLSPIQHADLEPADKAPEVAEDEIATTDEPEEVNDCDVIEAEAVEESEEQE